MRTIKFRGKTLEDAGLRKAGEWAYGGYFVDYCYGGCPEGKHYIVEFNSAGMGYFAHTRVEKESVGQYIGLKDELGKDIYEKDIVEYLDGEYSFRAIIELDYHQWYLKGISPIDNYSINDFAEVGQTDLKIIGNVYENPELLEGTK